MHRIDKFDQVSARLLERNLHKLIFTEVRGFLSREQPSGPYSLEQADKALNEALSLSVVDANDTQMQACHLGAIATGEDNEKGDKIRALPLNVTSVKLADVSDLSATKITQGYEQILNNNFGDLNLHCISYVKSVVNLCLDASRPGANMSPASRTVAIENFKRLKELMLALLKGNLEEGLGKYSEPILSGRPIKDSELSEGHKVILQWVVVLHALHARPGNIIITLDEPENHLHPEVLIDAIRLLLDANKFGQLWISTHSVPLIAYLFVEQRDDLSLYFMCEGLARFAGREPEKITESLLGGDRNIAYLRTFVDVPAQLAADLFAAECLMLPTVVAESSGKDPQIEAIQELLARCVTGSKVKVLDYGAGEGRLLGTMCETKSVKEIKSTIDYVAFDNRLRERCGEIIDEVYGPGSRTKRMFGGQNEMVLHHQPHGFDAVVMCNVLHEISPFKWLELFGSVGDVCRALKPNGVLILVEDYQMPRGEMAHEFGFIVLDTAALAALFDSNQDSEDKRIVLASASGKYQGRIKGHAIPACLFNRVTHSTIQLALKLAEGNAKQKINEIREAKSVSEKNRFRSGQEHSFWVQQFANIRLVLDSY
ncbi:AAA family ATPase [Zavarzinella formosa]|uniref:AAA family ATPase n=1 Tax=Zavarzinella formosa TaxID=360055 RepID=UPI0012F91F18|nr:AAA family ATPase [Zavarzinella formosa]